MKQREDGCVPLYKEWEVNVVVDDRDLNVLYQVDVNQYFVLLDRHKRGRGGRGGGEGEARKKRGGPAAGCQGWTTTARAKAPVGCVCVCECIVMVVVMVWCGGVVRRRWWL
jgi:hypothetical protein